MVRKPRHHRDEGEDGRRAGPHHTLALAQAEAALCSDIGGVVAKTLPYDDVLSLARASTGLFRAMRAFVFDRTTSLALCLAVPDINSASHQHNHHHHHNHNHNHSHHTAPLLSALPYPHPHTLLSPPPTTLPARCDHKRVLHASRVHPPHRLLSGLVFEHVSELAVHVGVAELAAWAPNIHDALPKLRDLTLRLSPPHQQHQQHQQHQDQPQPPQQEHQHAPAQQQQQQQPQQAPHASPLPDLAHLPFVALPDLPLLPPLHPQHQPQHQPQQQPQPEHQQRHGRRQCAVMEAPPALGTLLLGMADTLRSLSIQGTALGVLGPSFFTALPNLPKLQRLDLGRLSALPARHPLQLALRRVHNVTVLHVSRFEPRARGSLDAAMAFGCGLADGLFDSDMEVVELRVFDAWIPLGEVLREFVTLATLEWLTPGVQGIVQGEDYGFWEPGEDLSQLSALRVLCVDHTSLTPDGARAMVRMCPRLEALHIEGLPLHIPDVAHAATIPNTDATGFALDHSNHTVQILLGLALFTDLANLHLGFVWPHEAFSEHRVSLAVSILSHALEMVVVKTELGFLSLSLRTRKHAHPANRHAALLTAAGLHRRFARNKRVVFDVHVA